MPRLLEEESWENFLDENGLLLSELVIEAYDDDRWCMNAGVFYES